MSAVAGKTALVIEDNERTAETIALYLRDAGMTVETRADGSTGLRTAIDGAFDIVVLDWMLPGLDGIAVCRRLRRRSAVPIIMLTAKGHEDDLIAALDAGADDYIRKPFSGRELVHAPRAIFAVATRSCRAALSGSVRSQSTRTATKSAVSQELQVS